MFIQYASNASTIQYHFFFGPHPKSTSYARKMQCNIKQNQRPNAPVLANTWPIGQYSYLLSKSYSGAPKSQSNQISVDAATQHKNPSKKLKKQIKPTPTARLVSSARWSETGTNVFNLYHNRRIRFKSTHQPAFLHLLLRSTVAKTQSSQVKQEQAIQSTKQTTKVW